MISYFKNKKRRIAVIFILLPLAFFCFFKTGIFSEVFAPEHLESNNYNLEKKLPDNENSSQNYAELEIANRRDGDLSRLNGDATDQDATDQDAINQDAINRRLYDDNNKSVLPKLLEIPKIGVSANVQSVGLNSKREMDVPSNDWDVAWYNLGPKPGNIGSAVIAGHLDNKFGKPAVFWNLDELKTGDDVYVIDGNNNKKHFQVVSFERYETGTAPLEKIFGASDEAYLNLITCGGVWDKTKNNYSERFVVFTEYSL